MVEIKKKAPSTRSRKRFREITRYCSDISQFSVLQAILQNERPRSGSAEGAPQLLQELVLKGNENVILANQIGMLSAAHIWSINANP